MTDIAFSCGFSHLSYFSRTFLTKYGYTPGEYRKRNLDE
ncbi:MAG: AraC family transcriptional regulator [Oscillibacter sp.]|nr:AraC family transcriptional regulator [Oscillibacter sp.]